MVSLVLPPLKIVDNFILMKRMSMIMIIFSCDADPTALAKYVIALVKKDKPEPDLKALCEDQLDVFLGQGRFLL